MFIECCKMYSCTVNVSHIFPGLKLTLGSNKRLVRNTIVLILSLFHIYIRCLVYITPSPLDFEKNLFPGQSWKKTYDKSNSLWTNAWPVDNALQFYIFLWVWILEKVFLCYSDADIPCSGWQKTTWQTKFWYKIEGSNVVKLHRMNTVLLCQK